MAGRAEHLNNLCWHFLQLARISTDPGSGSLASMMGTAYGGGDALVGVAIPDDLDSADFARGCTAGVLSVDGRLGVTPGTTTSSAEPWIGSWSLAGTAIAAELRNQIQTQTSAVVDTVNCPAGEFHAGDRVTCSVTLADGRSTELVADLKVVDGRLALTFDLPQ